jgi:hypothetical protein
MDLAAPLKLDPIRLSEVSLPEYTTKRSPVTNNARYFSNPEVSAETVLHNARSVTRINDAMRFVDTERTSCWTIPRLLLQWADSE